VNIANQFEKIRLLFANDRFIAIMEEMAAAVMPQVKIDRIPGKEATHQKGQLRVFWTEQKVKVIWQNCPGEAIGFGVLEQIREAAYEDFPVLIVEKNLAFLDPTGDYVLQDSWNIEACGSWHGIIIAEKEKLVNNLTTSPIFGEEIKRIRNNK